MGRGPRRATTPTTAAALAIAAAAALAFDAAFLNGKDCVQTLGGIGFTWEHDAHLYLRRAITLHQLAGTPDEWRVRAAREVQGGARRRLAVDLGAGSRGAPRRGARAARRDQGALAARAARTARAPTGYLTPGWPAPVGPRREGARAARDRGGVPRREGAARQHRRRRVGAADLIVYGTPEQQERWILPTLRGEISWCQLFSEPGAGSDLAVALDARRRASRAAGCSTARRCGRRWPSEAEWGICLARTDARAVRSTTASRASWST